MNVTSALAIEIKPAIKQFILDEANAASQLSSSSPSDGAASLSKAIAYGVCKALTSTAFFTMFGPTVCLAPPPVAPAVVTAGNPLLGTLMNNVLKSQSTEL